MARLHHPPRTKGPAGKLVVRAATPGEALAHHLRIWLLAGTTDRLHRGARFAGLPHTYA